MDPNADLIGQKFANFEVIEKTARHHPGNGSTFWKCRCDQGHEFEDISSDLKRRKTCKVCRKNDAKSPKRKPQRSNHEQKQAALIPPASPIPLMRQSIGNGKASLTFIAFSLEGDPATVKEVASNLGKALEQMIPN